VQRLELLMVIGALVAIIVASIRHGECLSRLLPVQLQLGIGSLVGLIASVVVLVDRVDLIPDTVERPIAIASVGVAGAVWALMAALRRRAALIPRRPDRRAAGSRSSESSSGSPNVPAR
jgi:hypothetical protein